MLVFPEGLESLSTSIAESHTILRRVSELHTTEIVDSLVHLYGRSQHYDHIDVNIVDRGTTDIDEDPVALYLGYHD
jgi:hypothetical protein